MSEAREALCSFCHQPFHGLGMPCPGLTNNQINPNIEAVLTERERPPLASGLLDYFPDALAAVAEVSRVGSLQHHPDKPMHWDRDKPANYADKHMRHFMKRGTLDTDKQRHLAKSAWNILALLQEEIDDSDEALQRGPR